MERFVREVVVGGVSLVAGLWAVSLFGTASTWGRLGVALAALGALALAAGAVDELEV